MMTVVDLFCGCGGLSKGFENAGFTVCAAYDNWDAAVETYRINFPSHTVEKHDIATFQIAPEPITIYNPDMIVGGPPCQDFSSAGKRDETLGRADLTMAFANIIQVVKPHWFVMENVERAGKSKIYQAATGIFKEAGYGLTGMVLDASLCGVPQARKRLFMIGELGGTDNALYPFLIRGLSNTSMTVREYLGDIGIEHYYRHPRSYHRRGVFSIDEPSPTIRGVNRPVPPNYRPHPGDTTQCTKDLRPLTTRERSLIQTFPDNYVFKGCKADIEQLIGNAVPVKLAEYVARSIAAYSIEGPGAMLHAPISKTTQLELFVVDY